MINATFERLGVLSAESGAGKSSLLAAGYIPELRRLRALGRPVPPVLLLREWGGRELAAEERISDRVIAAVTDLGVRSESWAKLAASASDPTVRKRAAAIADCLRKDHENLDRIVNCTKETTEVANPPMKEVLQALSDRDGLIIIFDQFEEFMGSASADAASSQRTAEKVTHAVGRLFRDYPKLRILIALRSEYCRQLQRHLNIFVPNLDRRIIDLSPLPAQSIVRVVAGVSGVDNDDTKRFAYKLARACVAKEEAGSDNDSLEDVQTELSSEGSDVRVLEVQALLHGFDMWCTDRGIGDARFVPRLLDEYMGTLRTSSGNIGTTTEEWDRGIGRTALKHWIGDQLARAVGDTPDQDGTLSQRRRWILQPVLPRLSTQGGFKQHLPLLDLCTKLANQIFPGYGQLKALEIAVANWLRDPEKNELQIELGNDDLKILAKDKAVSESVEDWRTRERTRREYTETYIRELRLTMERLTKGRILKLTGSGKESSYELVHDGLSVHVREWSSELPQSVETVLGSPVPIVGDRFDWRTLGGRQGEPRVICDKHWIGCSVSKAQIQNVQFVGCDFRGLAFRDCQFRQVTFQDCELPAAIMIDCEIASMSYDGCNLESALFLNCKFSGTTRFQGVLPMLGAEAAVGCRHSELTGLTVVDCNIQDEGDILFEECILRFARIGRISVGPGRTRSMRFIKCDMMNAWIEDQGMPFVEVDQYCRTIGLLSYKLPPKEWLPRELSGEKS